MKGIRFCHEFNDKSKRHSAGTVMAALVGNGLYWSAGKACYETVCALFDHPNSAVCGSGVSLDYLHEKCKRVGEDQARTIHPVLFKRLDQS